MHRRTNTLSTTWGKYSSAGRIPSQHEASIRPWMNTLSKTWGQYSFTYEYPLKNMGQVFVRKYSYTDEYPLQNMGKYSSGRVPSQKHGASSIPWTSHTVSETNVGRIHTTYVLNILRISIANWNGAATRAQYIDENTTLPCLVDSRGFCRE